jgi:Na+-driven multidrug efflux pump
MIGVSALNALLAAVLCISGAFAVCFALLVSGRCHVRLSPHGLLRLDWDSDRKLLTISLPSGGENLARQLAGLITTKFVALYGTTAIAVLGVGQNLGAGNVERAAATARWAVRV